MVMKGILYSNNIKEAKYNKAVKSSSLPYPLIPFLTSFYAISNPVPPLCCSAEAANLSEEEEYLGKLAEAANLSEEEEYLGKLVLLFGD
ncbi:hypothetical protein DY000_02043744 [Brassica cretica]|uniref:Uncharacterized protein n=1 Tax=Brassica cretica TaxID=69181 RepID=A0ABQ7BDT2_BRACR|nr:hypothetical protein DY000_02043744 [Brassica cretica]